MSTKLKLFEWLAYAALAVNLLSEWSTNAGTAANIATVVATLIMAAIIWTAANRGKVWAAWIVMAIAVFAVLTVIGDFSASGPRWLRDMLQPDTPPTSTAKVLDVISMLLILGAVYFYFGSRDTPHVDRKD